VKYKFLRRGSRGSQFVESSDEVAHAGDPLWGRKNREILDDAPYVSDRRFDMYRDCHRAGG